MAEQCEICGYEPAPFLLPEVDPQLVEIGGVRLCEQCADRIGEDIKELAASRVPEEAR